MVNVMPHDIEHKTDIISWYIFTVDHIELKRHRNRQSAQKTVSYSKWLPAGSNALNCDGWH